MPTSNLSDRDIRWLLLEEAVVLHDAVLEYAGGGLAGFPHPEYLDSALHAPQQTLHYTGGGCDLYDLAAAYLFHIAKAHAFADGNKRTAYISAMYFLDQNGGNLGLPRNALALAKATERAARGDLDKTDLARIMRRMPRTDDPPKRDRGAKERATHRGRQKGKNRSKKRLF